MNQGTVLITGGAGFIGSHTCVELLQHGYEVIVIDDFSNSFPGALERVEKLGDSAAPVYEADLCDASALDQVFRRHKINTVIHFAGKKAVGESVKIPLQYYNVNVGATVSLIGAMCRHGVHGLVFSSSCSIYGRAGRTPVTERHPAAPISPYARSKWMCELIIADAWQRYPELNVIALRYFNPIGAHDSGLLGEDPRGVPTNIVPYLAQVAAGRLERLKVFGDDYTTPDGTCVRDYIHVMDVADGHRVALGHLEDEPGVEVLNLGSGVGTSVLELIRAFEVACGRTIPYEIVGRRPGDVDEVVADPTLVEQKWGWRATRGLAEMCRDAWNFRLHSPRGYES
jgi:UDP-glucose 4-epimerase